MNSDGILLKIEGVCKTYAVPVLTDISLEIKRGEIHSIVGENGAGKSTLCRIIAGLVKPNSGFMTLNGIGYNPESKRDAERHGIRIVMQELNVIPTLTIAENIFLTDLPNRFGYIDKPTLNERTQRLLEQIGMGDVSPDTKVSELGLGKQQLVEIAGGLSKKCNLLILDEPTAALTEPEVKNLFRQIKKLKEAGTSIIYISHRLEEVMQVSDTITVLRDGKLIKTKPALEFTLDEMVRLMVGRELEVISHRKTASCNNLLMRVEDVSAPTVVKNVSFELMRGEVLGFAGLMGSGRTELMRAIFGADSKTSGRIFIKDLDNPILIKNPSDAVRNGIAMLPESRKEQGLFLPLSVRVNITINNLKKLCRMPAVIDNSIEVNESELWRKTLSIKSNSTEQKVLELSGGNQQKILLARWLFKDCDILIMDEPTRGIDVGAKFEIYKLIYELAERGKGIIFVSSDLKELMTVCDRIAVMSNGSLAGIFNIDNWSQDKIMSAALSGYLKGKNFSNG